MGDVRYTLIRVRAAAYQTGTPVEKSAQLSHQIDEIERIYGSYVQISKYFNSQFLSDFISDFRYQKRMAFDL